MTSTVSLSASTDPSWAPPGWDGVAKVWDPQTDKALHVLDGDGRSCVGEVQPGRSPLFAAAWPEDDGGLVQVLDLRPAGIVHARRGVPLVRRPVVQP